LLTRTRRILIRAPPTTRAGIAAATTPPNSLIARKMRHTRTEHRAAATFALRATRAADAAARAPDVTPAQGGWEEEPGEEGGTTEK
jgi:hypothetical protein